MRWYLRGWPTTFDRAEGSYLFATDGTRYLDLFAGAGALNYGHNPTPLRQALVEYVERCGVTHSLDAATAAKTDYLSALESIILIPRHLDYRVMFPGPTGTDAVEAALRLARVATGRETILSFDNAFHGMTLGSLSVTGSSLQRLGPGTTLCNTMQHPFNDMTDGGFEALQSRLCSARDQRPAAVIVETVQAEGGVNVGSLHWMRAVRRLCDAEGVLFIIDDVQTGCGRTGPFFSFEMMGLHSPPDIVCLSKSLSGFGLPFAAVLLDHRIDVWRPGQHNGTFRGFDLAFVTGAASLREYWMDDALSRDVERRGQLVQNALASMVAQDPEHLELTSGRGLIRGLRCSDASLGPAICRVAFELGLLIETAGPDRAVVKILPPLTITDAELAAGLALLADAYDLVIRRSKSKPTQKGGGRH